MLEWLSHAAYRSRLVRLRSNDQGVAPTRQTLDVPQAVPKAACGRARSAPRAMVARRRGRRMRVVSRTAPSRAARR